MTLPLLLWVVSLLSTANCLPGFGHINQGVNDCDTVLVGDLRLHCRRIIGEICVVLLPIHVDFSHLTLMVSFPPLSNHLSSLSKMCTFLSSKQCPLSLRSRSSAVLCHIFLEAFYFSDVKVCALSNL